MNNIKLIYSLIISLLMVAITSCGGGNEPEPPKPAGPASRTVLVYMVAKNSLGAPGSIPGYNGYYDKADIEEMVQAAKAGDLRDGRLLVYHLAYVGDPVLVEVTADGLDTLKTYSPEVLSVTSERMSEVIDDAKTMAPALDYGIVLWSHASGWLENGIEDTVKPAITTYSYGEQGGKRMNVTTLAATLRNKDLSFVYFDCCNMATVEVAYQLRGVASKMVGSVTELPGPGMPYQLTMKHLFAPGAADLEGAAEETYRCYADGKLHPGYEYLTITVVDLTKMEALAEAAKNYYELMPMGMPKRMPQAFARNGYYYDLLDYAEALSEDADGDDEVFTEEVQSRLAAFTDVLHSAVTYQAALPSFGTINIQKHCGLSTYILRNISYGSEHGYDRLDWYADVVTSLKH